MTQLVYLIIACPLIGFLINTFFTNHINKKNAGIIASIAVLISFICSVLLFIKLQSHTKTEHIINLFTWISSSEFAIHFDFLIDPLSIIFLLVITGVGFLIHLYSIGYMSHDGEVIRYFSYLNLFVFFMLLLVLGNNYLIMFIGWEGVGLSSYLLIGFWFQSQENNNAAKKAFIMNRIGDLGFLLGIILILLNCHSLSYNTVFAEIHNLSQSTITTISLLLFVGAMGKSAQIPLYTWLPDAMAGPTPVSALIHAATMVTAGIYMVTRSNIFYLNSEFALEMIAIIGIITALVAASIALFQNDIKKILAYSTVSQLGLMFLGLGVGAFSASIFHVVTHAFFKALLFLGAGSIIHALGGEQDIRKMGGLKKALPITYITVLIGTIAISGIPPFAGFFSKDAILSGVFIHSHILWVLGLATSICTAFYMFRFLFLIFFGSFRGTSHQLNHLHESPKSMIIPLLILAIFSVLGGALGLPEIFTSFNWMAQQLQPILINTHAHHLSHLTEWILMIVTTILALCAAFLAYQLYVKKQVLPAQSEANMKIGQKIIYNLYYIENFYNYIITKPLDWKSNYLNKIDLKLIDAIINGIGKTIQQTSNVMRYIQTGNIGNYILSMVIGIIMILIFAFI